MLQRIDIENFRSIKKQSIQFEHNMTTLVGINESGKSNILKAMSLINDDIPLKQDDIRDPGHDEDPTSSAHVYFVFNLEEYMKEDIYKKIEQTIPSWDSKKWIIEKDNIQYTIREFIETQRKEYVYVADLITAKKYLTNWKLDAKEFAASQDWKRVKNGVAFEVDNEGTTLILAEGMILSPELVSLADSSQVEELDFVTFANAIDKAITDVTKEYLPECIHWKYSEENLLPEKIPKAIFAQNPKSCIPLRNMFLLAGYCDVTKTITDAELKTNGISNVLRKVSENATTHMRTVWPEWESIRIVVRENGNHFEAGIEDKYNVYSASRRSDGFKRFFTFLLMISVQNKSKQISGNILIIDEPEIGLHPSGVQFLRQELERISKNNLVMIATHSIFMIDNNIIDRHFIVEKENEITRVSRVESSNINDEEVIFKALGYSIFELLRPVNIIFEGWKDKFVFKKYIEGTKGSKLFGPEKMGKVGLLHALGVKDIDRVANICENFDRKYVIVTDSDNPAKEKKRAFKGRGEWICYNELDGIEAVTTEDFIDNATINQSVARVLEKEKVLVPVKLPANHKVAKVKEISDQLAKYSGPDLDRARILKLIKDDICDNLEVGALSTAYGKVAQQLSECLKKIFEVPGKLTS